jgi:2-(1,2-epoxy-1,2-dihydrophenyl)acetyl-CoA isomerase
VTDAPTVELSRSGGTATIVLDRPAVLNAWNEQLAAELRDAVLEVAADEGVRAVLLTGRGGSFSAGADVREGFTLTPDGDWDVHKRLTEVHHPIIVGIREMAKPVVAAVEGPAAGIGCALALACDYLVAAESAYFMLAFARIGLAPDGGAAAFVAARAGVARASEMALLGDRVPAPRALDWGRINEVVDDDRLSRRAEELLSALAAGPTLSYAATKRQLNAWSHAQLAAQLEFEAELQQELVKTQDAAEGVSALLEKRPASFKGR